MLNIRYSISEESYPWGRDIRVAYGIVAYALNDEDSTDTVVASVNDISSDRQAVAELVSLCNDLELSLVHLQDVVEDFIGDR